MAVQHHVAGSKLVQTCRSATDDTRTMYKNERNERREAIGLVRDRAAHERARGTARAPRDACVRLRAIALGCHLPESECVRECERYR